MKNAIYGLLAVLVVAGIVYGSAAIADTNTDEESESMNVYACPMFCDGWLTTDPDASCPVCNMSTTQIEELYVCPDHPDEFSLDPEMVCAESGEAYVPVEELYACPMHPEEISTDPEAECSICGMDLVAVEFDQVYAHVCSEECKDGCTYEGERDCERHYSDGSGCAHRTGCGG